MNSSFPNRWSFSYLKFTKYVANIIAEPKYKYGQQEQVTVRNHNRSTALEGQYKNTGVLKPVLTVLKMKMMVMTVLVLTCYTEQRMEQNIRKEKYLE